MPTGRCTRTGRILLGIPTVPVRPFRVRNFHQLTYNHTQRPAYDYRATRTAGMGLHHESDIPGTHVNITIEYYTTLRRTWYTAVLDTSMGGGQHSGCGTTSPGRPRSQPHLDGPGHCLPPTGGRHCTVRPYCAHQRSRYWCCRGPNPVTDPTPVKSSVKGASSFSPSKGPLAANFAASSSVADFAKSGLQDDTEQPPEPEPQPELGADQDGDADQADPTLQGIWTKSIAESATEVAKSNQLLLNKLCAIGRDCVLEVWDQAAVPISKTYGPRGAMLPRPRPPLPSQAAAPGRCLATAGVPRPP
jgi:hypothetical protein